MPISAADLVELTKVSLDDYLRNMPVDQIGTDRPLLKKLMSKRKKFGGAKQNIVANIRKDYGSNFTWAIGETAVAFNKRNTTEQVQYKWGRAVDGLYLDYDRLFSNGIKVVEGGRGEFKMEQNEKVQLVNLLNEQKEALREGFMTKLDLELHRAGSQSQDAIPGLDALISTTPATGVVGGLDRATAAYWRNYSDLNIATGTKGNLATKMNAAWRKAIRAGGSIPDFILAGSAFIDAYKDEITVTNQANAGAVKNLDAGVGSGTSTGLYFKGVEIIWDPQFETLDTLDNPNVKWEKRCYFINTKHLVLNDDGMQIITPTRPHDTLAFYTMVNLRASLVLDKSCAQAVLSIA